jgi:outer membrane protein assembly factor BamB
VATFVLASCLLCIGIGTAARTAATTAATTAAATVRPHITPTSSWTVYHGNALGTGADTSGVTFNPPDPAWTSAHLDGQVYGEPLEATGRVFVATENDTIYALAADSGAVLWSTHIGTPVPSGDLPCGDISPTVGITGTPVVDAARGEIFAVADELAGGAPAHVLVGLNLYTGASLLAQPVNPPGQGAAAILQRTGLNLSNGNVVFGYGGNDGDCSTYSGWVVSVPEGGGTAGYYQAVPIGHDGAVWMGGAAPEVDASGNIWVATGNGSSSMPYDFSDSVLELSPGLARTQYFAPSTWSFDNGHDQDLGSTAPALLSDGSVLQVGKSSTAYLLNQADLGGISAPPEMAACGSDADGGDAISGTVVYVPCASGVQAIQTSPSLSSQWQTSSGAHGPPIIAGGLVWSIGGSDLDGLNPANGTPVWSETLGGQANHFPTPSVGDGLLLAPSTDQVSAFSGSAGIPGPPSPPPAAGPNSSYWLVASDGGVFTFGNAGFYGSAGSLPLVRPVVGMAPSASKLGYWLVASDGGIFSYGDATFYGSMGGKPLNAPIVGMAATPDGGGYWEVASDGGIFSFGDAAFYGSMGGKPLNAPIVGMATTHDGLGYWLVASDGGIFSFGDAAFHGSMGGSHLNKPVVAMAATPDALGYWMVASDGGIFDFGDAGFFGSAGSLPLNRPVVGMAAVAGGAGYWLAASDGGVFTYGTANFSGSEGGVVLNKPVVGMAAAS